MYRSSIKKRFHKRSHNLWCFADRHCFWSHIFTVSSNRLATLPPYYVITVFLLLNFYSHLQVINILGVTVYSIHIRSSSADICLSHVVRDLFFWWSYCNFRRYKRQLWKRTFAGAPVRNDYNMRKNDYVIFFTMVNRRIRKQNVTDAMAVCNWLKFRSFMNWLCYLLINSVFSCFQYPQNK